MAHAPSPSDLALLFRLHHNRVCQIRKHVNANVDNKFLKVCTYHGPNREKSIPLIQYNKVDILITSYHTLAADLKKVEWAAADPVAFQKQQKKRKASGSQLSIFDVAFHRIVLDEAHIIRSGSKTGLFKAPVNLRAKYRWCLSGTPFVNKPSDLHSLLAFLKVEPLSHKASFDRAITNRIKNRQERGLQTLRTTMAYLALRRTKAQVKSTIKLVEKTVEERMVAFPEGKHKDLHGMLFASARAAFLGALRSIGEDGVAQNYMAFLGLVLRVRQACCHGGLVPDEYRENAMRVYEMVGKSDLSTLDPDIAAQLLSMLQGVFGKDSEPSECAVCLEALEEENISKSSVVLDDTLPIGNTHSLSTFPSCYSDTEDL